MTFVNSVFPLTKNSHNFHHFKNPILSFVWKWKKGTPLFIGFLGLRMEDMCPTTDDQDNSVDRPPLW